VESSENETRKRWGFAAEMLASVIWQSPPALFHLAGSASTALENDPHKVKHRQHLRTDGVKLVAWNGIEPSTRGFSTLFCKLKI